MAHILLVGTATLDIIFKLERHPGQDEEMRAQELRICRGGNAANSAVVLAQLGHTCSFMGVLAQAAETAIITQDLLRHGIRHAHCPRLPGSPPTSSIYLNGPRRSIVHYRDLPELTAEAFYALDLSHFDWIHFECRNVPELAKMLAHVKQCRPHTPLSLELEKPRADMESIMHFPSLLLCSKAYAQHCGYHNPQQFLAWRQQSLTNTDVVAAWGAAGAYSRDAGGACSHSPAYPPDNGVVDTLGAGDTFNAGLIDALVSGQPLASALTCANRLAGRKCGITGLVL